MLEVLFNFLNCLLTTIVGCYIIKTIVKSNIKIFNIKTIILLIVTTGITAFLQQNQYLGYHTLIIFSLNIIVYKMIFKLNYNDSLIVNSMSMIVMFISEIILTIISIPFIPQQLIEKSCIIRILINIGIILVAIIFINIKTIKNRIQNCYQNLHNNKKISNIIFLISVIVLTALYSFYIYINFNFSYQGINRLITMIIIIIITFLFIKNINQYNQLSTEYDTLFSYIQNFEDWIEKEQLNRHEYKNQLAVLRCISTEPNVKNKIDEILDDNIKIEGDVIKHLKQLPKGGLKGLMYYKTAIAQKNKIKLTIDVSIERKSILNNLNENQIKELCHLIGIYYDNAIEAALETRKKNILIEIYEFKDKVNIVISNTFKKSKNFDNRNEKGVTTKGEGHGNGLYFANKLISKNPWLAEKQEVIDNYYIQTITIKKLDT